MKKFIAIAALAVAAIGTVIPVQAATSCGCSDCGGKCCPCACEAGCC